MSADYRRRVRAIGRSDPIDTLACARAALAEDLPVAVPETDVREIKMLLDYREDLVGEMVRICCRSRWHLHDIDPDFAATIPACKLHRPKGNARVTAFLREREGSVAVSICLDLIERITDLGGRAGRLERELEERVRVVGPHLLELPGCGPMSAARIVAETCDPARFKSAAAFAMFTGYAPIPASSGNSQRVRLNRGGNRRMNAAIHRIAITPKRMHQPAQDYLATRRALGNSNTEAIRALKRHIARRVFALVQGGANAGRMTALTAKPAEPIAAWRLSVASLTHGLDRGGALRHSRSAPCARASALGARSSRR